MLKERQLMPVWNEGETWEKCRKDIVDILCNEEYGFLPRMHTGILWETESVDKSFCAGKATLSRVRLDISFGEDIFSFPIYVTIPNKEGKHPFFVHINFRDNVPDRYQPTEEICDRGFAVLSFCYNDVTVDDNGANSEKYGDGVMDILFGGVDKKDNHCGKIAIWAWAASRVMDYAESLACLDFEKSAVMGHSRLGKTALLAGALDERFKFVISNDSGCGGAAITRQKKGESVRNIVQAFSYWFCDRYKKYVDNEDKMPFDQHFLLGAIAPRRVYVASAVEDTWADPNSEYLACVAASEVYEKMGIPGFEAPDRLPNVGERFHGGNIAYHLRGGSHYLSREDWNNFMDYIGGISK